MLNLPAHQEVCRQFSRLLGYPDGSQPLVLASLMANLAPVAQEALASLQRFAAFLDNGTPARVEEIYTSCFDLQPSCHPYVGYLLFGESQARIVFLMRLKELYRSYGFVEDAELPDHLATMLRFLGSINDQPCRSEIIVDGLRPALEKLVAGLEGEDQPYLDLLLALRTFLNLPLADASCDIPAGREKECVS
ncbi:MAG: hypothetical protein Tsb0017_19180 [Geothermobacteraceae bacterium]